MAIRTAVVLLAATLLSACYPLGIAFHPDGKRFATVALRSGEDERADLRVATLDSRGTVVCSARNMSAPAWSPAGERLYFLAQDREAPGATTGWVICSWDGERVWEIASNRGGANAFCAPAISPDGRFLFCGEGVEDPDDPGPLVRRDLRSGERTVIAALGVMPVLSPKGDRLAFLAPNAEDANFSDLLVAPASGGEAKVLVPRLAKFNNLIPLPPAWSPDGTRIAVTGEGPRVEGSSSDPLEIVLTSAARGGRTRLSPEGVVACAPVWSRDGKTVYFTRHDEKDLDPERVFQVASDGGPSTPVQGAAGWCVGLAPDGRLVLRTLGGTKPDILRGHLRFVDAESVEDVYFTAQEYVEQAEALLSRPDSASAGPARRISVEVSQVLDMLVARFPDCAERPRIAALREKARALAGSGE